jgi:NAD-dependent deacetylase
MRADSEGLPVHDAAPSTRLSDLLRAPGPLLVLTGAGISAESGLDTFRGAGGLWEGRDPLEVATPEAFRDDPREVWRFYAARRARAAAARPNAAHLALASMESARPATTVVTQNVDGLHERAGTKQLVRLHGSLWRVRCVAEGTEWTDEREDLGELPPRCACGALLRPAVVWFGEALPHEAWGKAVAAARRASVVLVVGTSSLVRPAADLPEIALHAGAWVVEVNTEETPLSGVASERLVGPAGSILPRLAAIVTAGAEART